MYGIQYKFRFFREFSIESVASTTEQLKKLKKKFPEKGINNSELQ